MKIYQLDLFDETKTEIPEYEMRLCRSCKYRKTLIYDQQSKSYFCKGELNDYCTLQLYYIDKFKQACSKFKNINNNKVNFYE